MKLSRVYEKLKQSLIKRIEKQEIPAKNYEQEIKKICKELDY